MTTTVQSLVNDVRQLIDVAAQIHYTDEQLAQYVEDGVRRLYAVRPSSRYGDSGIDDQVFPELAPDTATEQEKAAAVAALLAFEVRVNESRWRRGIVYYAAGVAHEVGVTDSVKLQLSQTLKKQGDDIFAN